MVYQERIEVNKASKMPKAMEMDAIICAIKAMKKYALKFIFNIKYLL